MSVRRTKRPAQVEQESLEEEKKVDSKTDLLPIKGISKVMQARLRSLLHVNDAATLHYRGKTIAGRKKIATTIKASLSDVDSWVKQANLWQLEGMTADMAYLLVLIGVRHVSDLSNVDAIKVAPQMKSLSLVLTDFTFNESLLSSLIASAKQFVECGGSEPVIVYRERVRKSTVEFLKEIRSTDKRISAKDFERISSKIDSILALRKDSILPASLIETAEDAPIHLFVDDCNNTFRLGEENSKIVTDGLRLLIKTSETLPFPSVVCGTLVCEAHSDYCENIRNVKIEIEGIVSSCEEGALDDVLSTYTDSEGSFVIPLPSSYSLKEYVKFVITNGDKQQTIVKSRSQFLNSMPCYATFGLNDKDFLAAVKDDLANYGIDTDTLTIDEVRKEYILHLTEEQRTAQIGRMLLFDDIFEEKDVTTTESGNALPSVRLMGSEADDLDLDSTSKIINLNCDTAPIESFSYSMLQRLIAPKLCKKTSGDTYESYNRSSIGEPIDIEELKDNLISDVASLPVASTLGIGYVLNMHQGWVPDGFSLGSLLYSLVLAPGEEQRLIVRENTQSYVITDTASGSDDDKESYERFDSSDVQAIYNYGAQLTSDANSSYDYSTSASSFGGSISASGGMSGIFGLSGSFGGSKSKSSGNGSSSASQSNSQDEASYAAQTFQNYIRTASEKLSRSSRVSMSIATSNQSDSVATKIIANHNHSHAMTIQYWEVMRNYKLETNIDNVDLVLYVPLKPIQFLKKGDSLIYGKTQTVTDTKTDVKENFDKDTFSKRYYTVLKHASTLSPRLPYKYRSGLNLIQQYAAIPNWEMETRSEKGPRNLKFTMNGYFLENDDISVNLVLKNGKGKIQGEVSYPTLKLPNIFTSTTDLKKAMSEVWKGNVNYVTDEIEKRVEAINKNYIKIGEQKKYIVPFFWGLNPYNSIYNFVYAESCTDFYEFFSQETIEMGSWGSFTPRAVNSKGKDAGQDATANIQTPAKQTLSSTFVLPEDILDEDVSYVEIVYKRKPVDYTLYRGFSQLSESQVLASMKMFDEEYKLAKDNKNNDNEQNNLAHYKSLLPESFKRPNVTISSYTLNTLDKIKISDINFGEDTGNNLNSENISISRYFYGLTSGRSTLPVSTSTKTLRVSEFQKMEETFQHIVTNGIKYSQVVWSGLTENERVMLLEQYNLSLSEEDVKQLNNKGNSDEIDEPLLNCINVKKVLGYYGNCMLFPFTFPESLAEKLGVTSADLQNRIYRYHINGFMAPTTRISVPTRGMVGEAVLGESNVSEKIDITRFWNWQDSPIDSMSVDNNYLNSTDYLSDKSTKDIQALNLASAQAATPISTNDYISTLASKSPYQFNDITGLDQLKDVLNAGTTSASQGLSNMVSANKDMTNHAMTSLTETQKSKIEAETKRQETAANLLTSLFGGGSSKAQTSAGDGKKPAGDGKTPAGDGKTPAGDGKTPAGDGKTPAGDGNTTSAPSSAGSSILSSFPQETQVSIFENLVGKYLGVDMSSTKKEGSGTSNDNSDEVDALKSQIEELNKKISELEGKVKETSENA